MEKESYQLNMNIEPLYPQGVENTSLYDIVDRFTRGMLILPPHQRDFVWDEEKKQNFISRLKDSRRRPVGMLSTYQLDNNKVDRRVFLNDGSQRTRTSHEYLKDPIKYGDTEKEAEAFLRSYRMPVQHCLYLEHDEALVDFQLLNMGTHLTPYELCKGVFDYMDEKPQWPALIEKLHSIVMDASLRILENTRYKPNRETQHKFLRNDYALFHRFLTKEKSTREYDVSKSDIGFEEVKKRRVTEWQLRIVLEIMSPDQVESELSKFKQLIDRETSLMEYIWYEELEKPRLEAISPTLYRWLLHCAIWKRNNSIPNKLWKAFLVELFKTSNGNSQIRKEIEEEIKSYTISMSAISMLRGVCSLIDANDFYDFPNNGRRNRNTRKKEGTDQSHKLPFSTNGNGETILEPAGINRARGAKPIEASQ